MKLLELYKLLLTTGGLTVDDEGYVSAGEGKESIPFNVKGKRLVLPTKEHLANPDTENKVMFHPLSENVLRGESDVMARFRTAINIKLNYNISYLLEQLMVIGTSVKLHSKLSPDQSELLTILKDADEKTLTALQDILKTIVMDNTSERGIVHIYLKRGGNVDGKTYNRVSVVNFPLYKEILKGDKKVFDVTIRNKDRDVIIKLFQFAFTKIDTDGAYTKGSNCDIAPSLDSLMRALIDIGSCVNNLADMYSEFIDEDIRYNDSWVSVFDNLGQMLPEIRGVPMQTGNEGNSENKVVAQQPVTNTLTTPQPTMPVVNTPQPNLVNVQQPQSAIVRTSNGIDMAASLRNMGVQNNNIFQQPMYQRPAWGQPNVGMNQFQQPIQQPMQQFNHFQQPMQPMYPNQNGYNINNIV